MSPTEESPTTIGPYRILETLGEGGMGVVYLAEQREPIRRQVALKVIKQGMDTKEVIGRFESERQALAMMNHPCIARIHDAGTTDEGKPFFVMEYVPGVPITDYCDRHRLKTPERLELFIQVCQAIHHAHQKGIVHRDLKPSNVLVAIQDGTPVPKVIDFGVAKATEQRLTEMTVYTQQGQLIGTPEYMSPEQAEMTGLNVDTTTDIYSLGVILYQLLTGKLPFERRELMRAGMAMIQNIIREVDPPKPSTRISTIGAEESSLAADRRQTDLSAWRKQVKGELDWITLRAMEKDRVRRYQSASEFSADIERFLRDEPVLASPPSTRYRVRKFIRRNRSSVAVGLALLTALLAGTIGTTVGMIRANRAEAEAVAAAERAEAAVLFQISRTEENPAIALPYILEALERDDKLDYRLQAKGILLSSPSCWRLPDVPDGVNPGDMDISPDGRWLAAGWGSGIVQLYAFAGGEPRTLYNPDPGRNEDFQNRHVIWCRFSPDSRYLVTAARDSLVEVWLPNEGRLLRSLKLDGVTLPFFDLERHSLITVTRYGDGQTRWRSWPLSGGTPVDLGTSGEFADTFPCDLDPTRRWLIQAQSDSLFLYDLRDLAAGPVHLVGSHEQFVDVVAISPDGRTLFAASRNGAGLFWDIHAPDAGAIRKIQVATRPQYVKFDATGGKMTVGGIGGLTIWDLRACPAAEPVRVRGTGYWMFAGDIHPDGNWVVATGQDRGITAWPLVNEHPLTLDFAGALVGDMGFTPDGHHFVVAARDGAVWDVPLSETAVGTPKLLYHNGFGRYCRMNFDDDSRFVFLGLCGTPDLGGDVIRVPLDGSPVEVFPDVSSEYHVDAPGRRLAFVPETGGDFVRILDLRTGRARDLDETLGGFDRVAGFVRDGRLIVGKSMGTYGLWNDEEELFAPFAESEIRRIGLAGDRHTLLGRDAEYGMWRSCLGDSVWDRVTLEHPSYAFPPQGATYDRSVTYLVSGVHDNLDHTVIVDLETGDKHLYPLFEVPKNWGVIDPLKRWIAVTSGEPDGIIKFIRRPSGTPFEALPREEMLAKLRALTCLRAVPDEEAQLGFSFEGCGIPDWANPPTW